jgi:hypothetical protein
MKRRLKVQETGNFYKKKTRPYLHLQGKWLREAGFEGGYFVDVQVEPGKLVISVHQDRQQIIANNNLME